MHWVAAFLLFLNGLVVAIHVLEKDRKDAVRKTMVEQESGGLYLLSEIRPDSQGRCWLLGPYREKTRGEEVLARYEAAGLRATLQQRTIELAPEYWVYIPPFPSRKEAIAQLELLKAARIDSYLISQGNLKNGISLGFFSNSDTANALQQRRLRQNYQARIKEVPKSRDEYWIVLMNGTADNSEKRGDLPTTAEGLPPITITEKSPRRIMCPPVETSNKLTYYSALAKKRYSELV